MYKGLESVPSATNKTTKRQFDRAATSPRLALYRRRGERAMVHRGLKILGVP